MLSVYRAALVSLLLVALAPTSASQSLSSADSQRFDALVAAVDVDGLRAWAAEPAAPDTVAAWVNGLDIVLAEGEAYVDAFVQQRLRLAPRFTPALAGPTGSALYARFASEARAGDADGAVAAFLAARHFQAGHARVVLAELESALATARAQVEAREHEAALATIEATDVYQESQNTRHIEALRELTELRIRVGELRAAEAVQDRLFASRERAVFRGGIALTGAVLTRSDTGPVVLELVDEPAIDHDGFDAAPIPTLGAEAFGYVLPTLALGVGATTGRATYSSPGDPYFIDLSVSNRTLYGFARYLFRTKVGLRPYLSAGVGTLRVTREQTQGAVLIDVNGTTQSRTFDVVAEEESGLQGRLGLGFQFVPCAGCNGALSGEVSLLRNALDSPLVPGTQAVMGARITAQL